MTLRASADPERPKFFEMNAQDQIKVKGTQIAPLLNQDYGDDND